MPSSCCRSHKPKGVRSLCTTHKRRPSGPPDPSTSAKVEEWRGCATDEPRFVPNFFLKMWAAPGVKLLVTSSTCGVRVAVPDRKSLIAVEKCQWNRLKEPWRVAFHRVRDAIPLVTPYTGVTTHQSDRRTPADHLPPFSTRSPVQSPANTITHLPGRVSDCTR